MKQHTMHIWRAAIALIAVLSLGRWGLAQTFQPVYESVRELVPTLDAPATARGRFVDTSQLVGNQGKHDFQVILSGLPAGNYDLDIGTHAFVIEVGAGAETVFARENVNVGTSGRLITISQSDTVLLRTIGVGPVDAVSAGQGLLEKSKGKAKLAGSAKARAKAVFKTVNKVKPDKKYTDAILVLQFKKLEREVAYELSANGWPLASFDSDSSGRASVFFTTQPLQGDFILNFDPTEADYLLTKEGETTPVMEGRLTGAAAGGNLERINGLHWLMATTGIDTDAEARIAVHGASPDAVDDMVITAEALEQGDYDVMVGADVIGTLTIDGNGDGAAVFAVTPSGSEQALSVPVMSKLIRIVNGDGDVLLGRTLETQ
ncbi:MAG: hypothetical protein KDA20_08690 [Phycisphaerales bacterium]|nr:hypothetical protein [Phycisphaerales bacterium]